MIWGLKKVGPAAALEGISGADGKDLAGANRAPASKQ